jgi:hypothetical protein
MSNGTTSSKLENDPSHPLAPLNESAYRWFERYQRAQDPSRALKEPPPSSATQAPASPENDVAVLGQAIDSTIAPMRVLDFPNELQRAMIEFAVQLTAEIQKDPKRTEFYERAASTIKQQPLMFFRGVLTGFLLAFAHDIVGAFVFVVDVYIWVLVLEGCLESGHPQKLTIEELERMSKRDSAPCRMTVELVQSLKSISEDIDKLVNQVQEFRRDPLLVISQIMQDALLLIGVLADVVAEFGKQVERLAVDPNLLGLAVGGGAWFAVSMVVPDMGELVLLGKGAKFAKVATKLIPDLPDAADMEILDKIIEAYRRTLAKKHKKLLARMSLERFKIWQNIKPSLRKLGGDLVIQLRGQLRNVFHRLYLDTGSVRKLRANNEVLNARSTIAHYLFVEMNQAANKLDVKDLARESRVLQTKVLEAAHQVDERFFERFADSFRQIGWSEKDLMPGVSLTAFEHRQSTLTMFKQVYGIGIDQTDLPSDFQSVTTSFRKAIKFEAELSDAERAALKAKKLKDVFVVIDQTKASDLIQAHLDLWRKHHPQIANKIGPKLQEAIQKLRALNPPL